MNIYCAHTSVVDLDALVPNPKNPNEHPEAQIKLLAKIMKHQGWRNPIVISKRSGFITKGHGRLQAAKLNGWTQAPIDEQEYESEAMEYADMVADNKIAELSESNLSMINRDVMDLGPDFDLDLLGIPDFVVEPLDKLEPGCDEDAIPAHVEPKTKLGDIYKLGSHRLMCGDSTSIDAVEKLMNGEKADLLWTDPPYGVSYTDKNEYLNSIGKPMACPKAIENDDKSPEEMNELWFTVLSNAHTVMSSRSSYYIASPQGGDLMMMMSIKRAGFQLKHSLVWVKNNHVLGRCDYNYKHEPLLYGWKENQVHDFYGSGQCKTSVWNFNKPLKNDLHPTMKPIELIEEAILNSSKHNNNVLDLFGGSGSTLIACEKTNRKCFMMELDTHYCDVIVARWEKYTGKKAELINGET